MLIYVTKGECLRIRFTFLTLLTVSCRWVKDADEDGWELSEDLVAVIVHCC